MASFPFYSHTTPIRILKDMGMVWEAYHKGVPVLGVPGITLDSENGFVEAKKYFAFRFGDERHPLLIL